MQHDDSKKISRRAFVGSAAIAAAATTTFPRFIIGAPNNRPLKVGLVGCGGRGTGAAHNAIAADSTTQIVALADIAKDRLEGCRGKLKQNAQEIPDSRCFLGMDAYQKLLEVDEIDYVILATPPYYRPEHFTACIEAGKNVFAEKPVAVDPVGAHKMMAAGKLADRKELSVAAGTQRRHHFGYMETIKRIHAGEIGEIVSAQCYWNGGQLWHRERQAGWSENEWMHRDWVNWSWLSGDHIVEQHVHNIDVINWALGTHPLRVVGMGGRARRPTGNQFDFFSCDFEYPNDVHVHSMCRQIHGCPHNVSERVVGEKGISNCNGLLAGAKVEFKKNSAQNQEHKDLQDAIRSGKRINETQNVAESTLCAIMGRTSAYTGKGVTWDEMMKSDLVLGPPDYELTEANIRTHIPVPGERKS